MRIEGRYLRMKNVGSFCPTPRKGKSLSDVNKPLLSSSSSKALLMAVGPLTGKPNFTRQFSWSALHHRVRPKGQPQKYLRQAHPNECR